MVTPNTLNDVINSLVEKYPNRLPLESLTSEQLARKIGQQDVILYLLQHLEKSERRTYG
jgi:hypothetical protein